MRFIFLFFLLVSTASADWNYFSIRHWLHLNRGIDYADFSITGDRLLDWDEQVLGAKITPADVAGIDTATARAWVLANDNPQLAEIDTLESDLTNAVYQTFGLMPPYSQNAQDTYKATLRTQMKSYRQAVNTATTVSDLRDAQKELNLRQQIINLVREIEKLDSSWKIGDVE